MSEHYRREYKTVGEISADERFPGESRYGDKFSENRLGVDISGYERFPGESRYGDTSRESKLGGEIIRNTTNDSGTTGGDEPGYQSNSSSFVSYILRKSVCCDCGHESDVYVGGRTAAHVAGYSVNSPGSHTENHSQVRLRDHLRAHPQSHSRAHFQGRCQPDNNLLCAQPAVRCSSDNSYPLSAQHRTPPLTAPFRDAPYSSFASNGTYFPPTPYAEDVASLGDRRVHSTACSRLGMVTPFPFAATEYNNEAVISDGIAITPIASKCCCANAVTKVDDATTGDARGHFHENAGHNDFRRNLCEDKGAEYSWFSAIANSPPVLNERCTSDTGDISAGCAGRPYHANSSHSDCKSFASGSRPRSSSDASAQPGDRVSTSPLRTGTKVPGPVEEICVEMLKRKLHRGQSAVATSGPFSGNASGMRRYASRPHQVLKYKTATALETPPTGRLESIRPNCKRRFASSNPKVSVASSCGRHRIEPRSVTRSKRGSGSRSISVRRSRSRRRADSTDACDKKPKVNINNNKYKDCHQRIYKSREKKVTFWDDRVDSSDLKKRR